MTLLSEEILKAWDDRDGAVVLITVDAEGNPNAIYATCVSRYDGETIVVADNYFDKTRANIMAGCRASLLFITAEKKSYQLKGTLTYHTGGPIFEDMKRWNPTRHPGHAAAALKVDQAFSGAKRLI